MYSVTRSSSVLVQQNFKPERYTISGHLVTNKLTMDYSGPFFLHLEVSLRSTPWAPKPCSLFELMRTKALLFSYTNTDVTRSLNPLGLQPPVRLVRYLHYRGETMHPCSNAMLICDYTTYLSLIFGFTPSSSREEEAVWVMTALASSQLLAPLFRSLLPYVTSCVIIIIITTLQVCFSNTWPHQRWWLQTRL